jgi:hypothetical protein
MLIVVGYLSSILNVPGFIRIIATNKNIKLTKILQCDNLILERKENDVVYQIEAYPRHGI